MPRLSKDSIRQFARTGCEKQLRISMHPTTKRFRAERTQLRLPDPQIRPALQAMTAAGEEWGRQKVGELDAAFGDVALLGARRRITPSASSSTPAVEFGPSLLKDHLPQARPGRFLIECGYRVDTATFRSAHNLNAVATPETGTPFTIEDARPDVIEVLHAEECANTVTIGGDVVPHDDDRMALRVIDVKLSSEPGPQYFAELAYYVLALAAWLKDTGWDDQFVVSADAAVWPGNEGVSRLGQAVRDAASANSIRAAFHDDLVEAPQRVFVATVLRILRDHIPRVLRTPLPDLPWAVTTQCQGCEHLGQRFTNIDSEGASAPKAGHCIPTAEREQNLSRLPFLSRGAFKVLRKHGIDDVPAVADLGPDDPTYRQHHRLRGQRSIVGSRARALGGGEELPLHPEATTTAIPAWAKLRIYVSADFDPGSARTLAFGLHWRWVSKDEKPTLDPYPRVHYTAANTDDDEWLALSALLGDLHQLLSEAADIDPNTTVQVYVWDTVTFEHLTRVIGRHLDRILASGHLNRLAWIFPPETVIQNVKLAATPVVSVIRDAVVGLLTLPLPHTYNLLGAARLFHRDQVRSSFRVPPYWDDPFSDQIPPERAHQLWNGRTTAAGPSPDEVVGWLHETVRTKLFAMNAVADALTEQMHGRLPRRAPRVTALRPPTDEAGLSHLGLLLLTHARLNAAISAIDIARTRSQHVEEREASFEAARLRRRITGSRRIGILTRLGLPTTAAYEVFEINAASVEVKAGSGDFLWSVLPESMTHRGGESFDFAVRSAGGQSFGAARDARRSLADVFAVTVEHIDRVQRILVVQFSNYGGADRQRQRLRSLGVVSLDADLVLDRLSADFFTSKLRTTLHAIGNPEGVLPDPQVARAMNLTRTPRQRGRPPVAELLWDAAAVADTVTPFDLDAARRVISAHGHRLNEPQQHAWEHALSHRLTLIWGPPGTGKTATLRAILAALASARAAGTPKRIVLTANNYNAIDTVLRPLVEQLRAAGDTTPVRRLRSESRADVAWLNAEENVATDNRNAAALEATAQLLTDGAIVTGPPQQLHKLLTTAYGSATADLFDVLVIDEASQMDVANASLALAGAAPDASVIVAGDPLQLPPIHASEPPAGFEHLVGSVYEFFARHHGIPEQHLEINYRSNAEIVALARRAGYSERLQAASPTRRVQYVVPPAGAVPSGWPATMVWDPTLRTIADPDRSTVAVTYPEGTSGQWNNFEAGLVAALVATYRLHAAATLTDYDTIPELADDVAFWTRTIGIVTPHRAQRSLVVRELVNAFASEPHQTHLRPLIENAVDTVERFQGQERDIIIGTYAVGDPDTIAEEDEFLLNLNRFNVMATRARAKLIVIATDELVGHISADLDVVRSSEMLKDFVATYCNTETTAPVTVQLTSRTGQPATTIVQPTVTVRWRQSAD